MRRYRLAAGLVALPMLASAGPSTSERLELLERRVALVSELTLQLDQMRNENRQLRGELENLAYEIEQLKRKQRDIYEDIDQRLSTLSAGPATSGGVAQGTAAAASAPVASAPSPGTPVAPVATGGANVDRDKVVAEYEAAYALLSPQQKRYAEAAAAFEKFLEKYPGDELAPNAYYWLGEAHYVSQKNAAAKKAFEAVVAQFPSSQKAPDSLFKIGRLQEAAGDASGARTSYQRVLKDYPNASAVGLARQRLDAIGR